MSNQADVLIVTVTPTESKAVLQAFKVATGQASISISIGERTYRNLGIVNHSKVFMAISEMGAGGLGAAQQTVQKAVEALNPDAVIMVGIAFGMNETEQSIGDILVSKQLMLYESQRLGNGEIIVRGDRPHCSTSLFSYLKSASLDWCKAKVHFGLILTGEKLIDDLDYRQSLEKLEAGAIGGEMEGAGLYVSCQDEKVDWILVKAICDWADGNKNQDKEQWQQLAAKNAAEFVLYALNQAELPKAEKSKNPPDKPTLPSSSQQTEKKVKNAIQNAELLPYLTNRMDQELKLGKKIKNHQPINSPLICIIHGKEEDCSDTFIKRLRYHSLNTIIPDQIKQGVPQWHYITCDSFNREEDLHEKMWASLGKKITGNRFSEPETIAKVIAQQNCPVLLWTTLGSDKKGVQSIEFFLKFWQKWPQILEQKYLLLICLSFKYKEEKAGFFSFFGKNKAYSNIQDYLENLEKNNFSSFKLNGVVLPELTEIEQTQVEDWAKEYLGEIYEKLQPKIKKLFEKQKKIAMQTLSEELDKMLKEFA